jgi:hypothetical protein
MKRRAFLASLAALPFVRKLPGQEQKFAGYGTNVRMITPEMAQEEYDLSEEWLEQVKKEQAETLHFINCRFTDLSKIIDDPRVKGKHVVVHDIGNMLHVEIKS